MHPPDLEDEAEPAAAVPRSVPELASTTTATTTAAPPAADPTADVAGRWSAPESTSPKWSLTKNKNTQKTKHKMHNAIHRDGWVFPLPP